MKKMIARISVVALALAGVYVGGCQSSQKAEPQMMTGDQDNTTHQRYDTGIDSHVNE